VQLDLAFGALLWVNMIPPSPSRAGPQVQQGSTILRLFVSPVRPEEGVAQIASPRTSTLTSIVVDPSVKLCDHYHRRRC
jgi:hypothetical protein